MKTAIILDIILIGVIVLAALVFMKKGFLAGIVNFVGTLAALLGASMLSSKVAPWIFEKFFQTGLVTKVTSLIDEKGTYYLDELVESVSSFFPVEYVKGVLENALATIDSQSATLATDIVKNAFAPLFAPIISIVLFLIVYTVLKIIVSEIARALVNVNKIPLVGTVNQMLGLGSGVLCGILQVALILFAVWGFAIITNNAVPVINATDLQGSYFYSMFLKFNPFFH